jgi:hypothetical protein
MIPYLTVLSGLEISRFSDYFCEVVTTFRDDIVEVNYNCTSLIIILIFAYTLVNKE